MLTRDDFRTVSAVSGGSIAAAHLATVFTRLSPPAAPGTPLPEDVWNREVQAPLRAFTARDRRTGPFLKRLLPWNLSRTETTVEALAARYEKELTPLRLAALPERPHFLFLATDMAWGVSWEFSRERMGDWQAGYLPPGDVTVGRAVAASACCPPLFGPMRLRLDPIALKGGSAPRGRERDECLSDLRLTDGGVYDNMGLEPVWKDHAVVLVSDAGGLFDSQGDKGLFWRLPRYAAIQERQSRALRKRWLIASYVAGTLEGGYWGTGSAATHYDEGYPGYSAAFAAEVVARMRTDLDAFSEGEAAVLENHGYLLADAAVRRHVPALLGTDAGGPRVPHPEWFPPARSEAALRSALADSGRRRTWGRG